MKRTLKACQLTLTVLGPVFVGSGKEISRKEYLFLSNGSVAVMNMEKLYARLEKRRLQQEYVKFMLSSSREGLRMWLRRQAVPTAEIRDCVRYVLDQQDTVDEKTPRLQIMEFMKDPYGKPYIPGSSVKGMLRTALLCRDIMEQPTRYNGEMEQIKKELFGAPERMLRKVNRASVLARSAAGLETRRYHLLERNPKRAEDAVNDILSGLIVSDSQPLELQDLILCQKIDCHPDGQERKLPILRECLRPGTQITCSLTIDESVCSIGPDDIRAAICGFAEMYEKNFLRHFPGTDELPENAIFLGGGSGFVSKTMIYAMFPDRDGVRVSQTIFEKTGVPRVHGHSRDMQKGVSPHTLKCTHYHGKMLQMGLCACHLQS